MHRQKKNYAMSESATLQRLSGGSYLLEGLQRTPPTTPSVHLYATLQSLRSSRHSTHVNQPPLVSPFVATPLAVGGGDCGIGGGGAASTSAHTSLAAAIEPPLPPEMHAYVSPRHSWGMRDTPSPATGPQLYSYADTQPAATLSSAGTSKVRSGRRSRRRHQPHENAALYNPSLMPIQSGDASSSSSDEQLPIRNIKEELFRQHTADGFILH